MQTKDSGLKYPSRYELEQTLSEYCPRHFLDEFAQSRGIFITKANKEELANHLSGFFFEHKDIEIIREMALREDSHKALSGFIIKSEDKEFDPIELLDLLRGSDELGDGITLGTITKTELSEGFTQAKGKMEYIEYKPGRIELLHKENRSVEFTVNQLSDDTYQVFVESNKTKDAKKFESFVKKEIGREARLDTLDIELLSDGDTILFFDALTTRVMEDDWRFLQIKKLIFRKSNNVEEEARDEALSVITQAILEGKDLRNNAFVKQCETSGYKFTAMTFEYENKFHPFVIDVKIEFKLRPVVFEVGVQHYKKIMGLEEHRERAELSAEDEIKMKTYIWQQSREIYNSLALIKTTE